MTKPIDKVTQAVKLKMQIIAMTRKWEQLFWELSGNERLQYAERIKCDH